MTEQVAGGKNEAEQVVALPVARIDPNPRQPRRQFHPGQISELAQSIRSQGVIQPLVVRPHATENGRYELVAGERRLRAMRLLGWEHAPALIRDIPDHALLEAALVENLQREQLTPLEEAQAYQTLLERYDYTQESLSQRVGKDRSTIANMVRLLALPLLLREDLDDGRLTAGHARALLAIPEAERQVALRNIVLARSLSVRETEQLVNRERSRNTAEPTAAPDAGADDLHYRAAQDALERRFATRVGLQRQSKEGGRIEIEYYSSDDFNRIYDLLMSRG